MLKDTWKEIGRLESLFLEIIEDPTKKEVLLYPICYCQLVRKESSFEIDLPKLISCANKTFHTFRGRWQDILLELDLFQFITPRGDVIYGKDILRVSSPDGLTVSFLPEYREIFYEVYSKLLRYWTVLSKISSYSKRNTPAEAVHMNALIFNEELFSESAHYASLQSLRFPQESPFFEALKKVSEFYAKLNERGETNTELIEDALKELSGFDSIYYGANLGKFKRDLEVLLRETSKGRKPFVVKISFTIGSGHGTGLLSRIFSKLLGKLKELGGKRWILMNSGTDYSSFTGTCWRRQRELPTHA
ncbi:MAG: hypothetical protein GXO18_07905 [Aquificae bacterium]|nr:hypothetical protein [Aquificota bacterium]